MEFALCFEFLDVVAEFDVLLLFVADVSLECFDFQVEVVDIFSLGVELLLVVLSRLLKSTF